MKPKQEHDVVWAPVSEVAEEFQKCPFTIRKWCSSGFILSLGYKVKKDPTGHWLIGVNHSEYRNFRNRQLAETA